MKTQRPHYSERLLMAWTRGNLPSGVVHTEVRHDDWCPVMRGTPDCRCEAEVVLLTPSGEQRVLDDGSIEPMS